MANAPTQQKLVYCFAIAVVIAVLIATTLAYLHSRSDQLAPLKSMDTWQQADVPLGYPLDNSETAPFDNRFIELNAFEKALIPSSPRMSHPMGSMHGALTYYAQRFWSDNTLRGGHHTGDDVNGIGGMNTDLGDPIYAVANGLVIYRGHPSQGWGNSLILAHRKPDGTIHQFMYSHMQNSRAAPGELISMGEKIGTVGTANMNYPAHLHLELRKSTGVWIGAGYVNKTTEHLDPNTSIVKNSSKPSDSLVTPPMLIAKKERLAHARSNIIMNRK